MSRVRCIGPKSLLRPTVDLLHAVGVVHIESAPLRGGTVPLARLAVDDAVVLEKTELERVKASVSRGLIVLPVVPDSERPEGAPPSVEGLRAAAERVATVMRRVDDLSRRRKRIEDELVLVSRYARVVSALAPLLRDIPASRDVEYVGITLERRDHETIRTLRDALARLTDDRFELLLAEVDDRLTAGVLVCPATLAPRVKAVLGEEGVGEMPLPASLAGKPWGRAVAVVLNRQLRLPRSLARCRAALDRVSRCWRAWFADLDRALDNRLMALDALVWVYETEMTFWIDGWVPSRDVASLRERLRRELGGRVVIEASAAPNTEAADAPEVPVALFNARWMAPFEGLVRLVALPRYGTIDPTPFLAAGFPFLFGMIVGDVVYGIVLLVCALGLRRRYADHAVLGPAARIGVWACAWTIVFGALFGEYAGTLGERWGLRPILFDRLHAFRSLFVLTAAVGAVHVGLGIGLGLVTAIRAGRWGKVRAKLGGLAILLGALALASRAGGIAPAWATYPAAGAIALGFAALVSARDPSAFMELHNPVNVLSYLRLMGIGVASAALAFAANLLGAMSGHAAVAVLIGLTLHGINLVFAVVSPAIQSLRLHYVEFFENFFQPGGREYRPFRRIEAVGHARRGTI